MLFARLWRAIVGPAAASGGGRAGTDPAGVLRHELRIVGKELSRLQRRMQQLDRQVEQLRVLRRADAAAGQHDAIVGRLDVERAARHLRDAVAAATRIEQPVPHLIVHGLWPADVFDAIVQTIPDPVFFDRDDEARHILTLPPRLAPVASIVTWALVTDLVREVLGPALAARFEQELPPVRRLQASPGVLLRRSPGDGGAPAPSRPGWLLTTVVDLQGAGGAYGSLIGGDPALGQALPFTPNTAVTMLSASAPGYAPIPAAAPAVERLTYEFSHYAG